MGVPVRGQQQADHHQRPHAPHHLHHQGGGLHQHWARAPLQPGPGDSIKKNKCKNFLKTLLLLFFCLMGTFSSLHTLTDFLHYYTMILQRIRIIVEDAGFEPGTSAAPEVCQ